MSRRVCRGPALLALSLLAATCDRATAPDASGAVPSPPPAPAPTTVADPDPAIPGDADLDVAAEQLDIEQLSPGVLWVSDATVREVLFVLATGAWRLEPGPDGIVLRVGRAPRLASRLGVRDGDVFTAVDGVSLRSSASARAILDAFTTGKRVQVTSRRGGDEQRAYVRVAGPGRGAPERVEDLVTAGRRDTPEPAIERGVLLAFGEAESRLAAQPERVLELLGLPADATEVGLDGESVVLSELPRLLGERATAERVEIAAGDQRVALRVITGTVESAALADALRSLPRPRGAARTPPGTLLDPFSTDPPAPDPPVAGIERVDDTHVRIERGVIESWLDPASAMRLARIVPAIEDGEPRGFKLYAIRRPTAERPSLSAVGFANGDLVTGVNGHALTSVDDALAVYTKLAKAETLVVAIVRRGTPMELTIDIVDHL